VETEIIGVEEEMTHFPLPLVQLGAEGK